MENPVCLVCNVSMEEYKIVSGAAFYGTQLQFVRSSSTLIPRAFVCPVCHRLEWFAFPISPKNTGFDYSSMF